LIVSRATNPGEEAYVMGAQDTDDMAKVRLSNSEGDSETLWAFPVGDNRYKLDNSPFYAYDVSWQDVIEAKAEEPNDIPTFVQVVEKSGNRTIRIILDPPADESRASQQILNTVREMGCSYEGANSAYISVNIPPGVELSRICDFLTNSRIQWEHADPSYKTLYPDG
jgi:hypothetical protein